MRGFELNGDRKELYDSEMLIPYDNYLEKNRHMFSVYTLKIISAELVLG